MNYEEVIVDLMKEVTVRTKKKPSLSTEKLEFLKSIIDTLKIAYDVDNDDELELELFRIVSEQEPLSVLITKYFMIWDKLKMKRYHPEMWRKDAKTFYQKWIVLWEMAEKGKVPAWQINWHPIYLSDYLSFIEQIKILKECGHDPWPLIQQLPITVPQKHRTLEEVVFKK